MGVNERVLISDEAGRQFYVSLSLIAGPVVFYPRCHVPAMPALAWLRCRLPRPRHVLAGQLPPLLPARLPCSSFCSLLRCCRCHRSSRIRSEQLALPRGSWRCSPQRPLRQHPPYQPTNIRISFQASPLVACVLFVCPVPVQLLRGACGSTCAPPPFCQTWPHPLVSSRALKLQTASVPPCSLCAPLPFGLLTLPSVGLILSTALC